MLQRGCLRQGLELGLVVDVLVGNDDCDGFALFGHIPRDSDVTRLKVDQDFVPAVAGNVQDVPFDTSTFEPRARAPHLGTLAGSC